MTNTYFKKWNTLLGWITFTISLIVYALTIEPTVSFWDAGEYILTSAKLQVGHPPGAPLFQMIGAFFSTLAFDASQIGMMMNMMSAFSSAFTILFMFWSLTLLLNKLKSEDNDSKNSDIAVLGSAFVGSLSFAFTDSFWFNAAETEVYAMATLIMAVMFWAALRWEKEMHTSRGNKWLILISFITGLSFGVHFMGLLTIPAIGLIYFFKNYNKITIKQFIIANVISVAVLLFIFKLLLPSTLKLFGYLEVFFVNTIGLPFNSGTIVAAIIIISVFSFGLRYTRSKQYVTLNTLTLCLLFIFIGFSSWLMLPIRANANVIINENNPSDARELLAYYNLEQYPETHLFYGPLFTDQFSGLDENQPYVDDKKNYERNYKTGKYEIINDWKNSKQNYNSEHAAFLPRMWSAEHAENYMMFTGLLEFKIKPEYLMEEQIRDLVSDFRTRLNEGRIDYEDYNNFLKQFGQYLEIEKPTFIDNLSFLIEYQLGYMYWRYFMWNFTGRQDDIQGKYNGLHGNWLSGIKFIDEMHLGLNQENLPSDVLNNKGRNTYYFLPFILGLIGFFFLYNRNKNLFWVMLVFFLFTGIAIQVYTNVRPFEPRERDYSVVGSFYVFALWIGFGAYAIIETLRSKFNHNLLAPAITLICLILVPLNIISDNWDDHDRSNRRTANAMAVKYLESCAPNAILFTIGDNDSFPLWYAQEIEGIRKDVRVINTSLFQTDWYIDQMKRKAYTSDPIPSKLTHNQYRAGTRDYLMVREITDDTLDIKTFMNFISSDEKRFKLKNLLRQVGEDPSTYPNSLLNSNYLPTRNISIPVNKEMVLKNGIVADKDKNEIVDNITIKISGGALYKNRLLMLDIIANNNWERPIYFTGGAFGDEDYIWMKDYLQLDGMCYKLTPIKTKVNKSNPFDMGRIDSELMYNQITSWNWGNSGENIYHDPETRKNGITYRGNIARCIEQLITEEKYQKAEELADLTLEKMPVNTFGYYTLLEPYISAYYEIDKKEKARNLFAETALHYQEKLIFYSNQSIENQTKYLEEIITDIERYRSLVDVLIVYNDSIFAQQETERFNSYLELFRYFTGETDVTPEEDIDIENNLRLLDSN